MFALFVLLYVGVLSLDTCPFYLSGAACQSECEELGYEGLDCDISIDRCSTRQETGCGMGMCLIDDATRLPASVHSYSSCWGGGCYVNDIVSTCLAQYVGGSTWVEGLAWPYNSENWVIVDMGEGREFNRLVLVWHRVTDIPFNGQVLASNDLGTWDSLFGEGSQFQDYNVPFHGYTTSVIDVALSTYRYIKFAYTNYDSADHGWVDNVVPLRIPDSTPPPPIVCKSVPIDNPSVCNGVGTCLETGICDCPFPYAGDFCGQRDSIKAIVEDSYFQIEVDTNGLEFTEIVVHERNPTCSSLMFTESETRAGVWVAHLGLTECQECELFDEETQTEYIYKGFVFILNGEGIVELKSLKLHFSREVGSPALFFEVVVSFLSDETRYLTMPSSMTVYSDSEYSEIVDTVSIGSEVFIEVVVQCDNCQTFFLVKHVSLVGESVGRGEQYGLSWRDQVDSSNQQVLAYRLKTKMDIPLNGDEDTIVLKISGQIMRIGRRSAIAQTGWFEIKKDISVVAPHNDLRTFGLPFFVPMLLALGVCVLSFALLILTAVCVHLKRKRKKMIPQTPNAKEELELEDSVSKV